MAPTSDNPGCILDFSFYHGVDGKTGIVIKELAVIWGASHKHKRQHWVFLPPYPENCLPEEVRALNAERVAKTKYAWSEGDVPYEQLETIIKRCTDPFDEVYVCGHSRARFIANLTNKTVMNFITLYNNVIFGTQIGAIYHREHGFASTCLKHNSPKESPICAKARVTYQYNMLTQYFPSVKNGMARMEIVLPDAAAAAAAAEAAAAAAAIVGSNIEEGEEESNKESEGEEEMERVGGGTGGGGGYDVVDSSGYKLREGLVLG
jgi:hypothetical protein